MSDQDYTRAPAPWQLTGRAYAFPLRLPEEQRTRQSGVPDSLGAPRGRYSIMMFVEYTDSDVGPYQELLFIPGHYHAGDHRWHRSIGHIYVSSHDSVINGRLNWGIPKDQASFTVERDGREEQISVARNGQTFCRLTVRHGVLGLPLPAALVPARLRTLTQIRGGKRFIYTPRAGGILRRASLKESWADGIHFPAIQAGTALPGGYMPTFNMTFPVARISDLSLER